MTDKQVKYPSLTGKEKEELKTALEILGRVTKEELQFAQEVMHDYRVKCLFENMSPEKRIMPLKDLLIRGKE
jgi:hypothetical protein